MSRSRQTGLLARVLWRKYVVEPTLIVAGAIEYLWKYHLKEVFVRRSEYKPLVERKWTAVEIEDFVKPEVAQEPRNKDFEIRPHKEVSLEEARRAWYERTHPGIKPPPITERLRQIDAKQKSSPNFNRISCGYDAPYRIRFLGDEPDDSDRDGYRPYTRTISYS